LLRKLLSLPSRPIVIHLELPFSGHVRKPWRQRPHWRPPHNSPRARAHPSPPSRASLLPNPKVWKPAIQNASSKASAAALAVHRAFGEPLARHYGQPDRHPPPPPSATARTLTLILTLILPLALALALLPSQAFHSSPCLP
jgi:hypothetical protein